MQEIYPLRLEASLHQTLWGGRRLEEAGWKQLPEGDAQIGESWETEISTVVQNGPLKDKTLGEVVEHLQTDLLGEHAVAIFGQHFPLLAKFIDAREKLSVQVHPDDTYAAHYEGGKAGKTEFWYILDALPEAKIVHGFKAPTGRTAVQGAIEQVKLEELLHEEIVEPEDVIFVPAGTVHAIGGGVLLYELQEYSDVTYRMYDYGRLDAQGRPRELHIERSLDVSRYEPSPRIKASPVTLIESSDYVDRCLVACRYFVCREIILLTAMEDQTNGSCIIVSALGADLHICYGENLAERERLKRGQTLILPAKLGRFQLVGPGACLYAYVPSSDDEAWRQWQEKNG